LGEDNGRVDVGFVRGGTPIALSDIAGLFSDYGLDIFGAAWAVNDAGAGVSSFVTTDTTADDDYCVGQILVWASGSANYGQCHVVTGFTASSDTITIYPACKNTPVDADGYVLIKMRATNAALTLGGNEVTYTLKEDDEDTGDPVVGANIWVTDDAAGTNVIWAGITDASGILVASADGSTKPRLSAGTYYFWRYKSGMVFVNPDTETFS
jgi:hypothetical protein